MSHNILLTGGSGYLGGTLLARWNEAQLPSYEKLFALVRAEGMNSTRVVVTGTERSAVARRAAPTLKQVRAAPRPAYETRRRLQPYDDASIPGDTDDWW